LLPEFGNCGTEACWIFRGDSRPTGYPEAADRSHRPLPNGGKRPAQGRPAAEDGKSAGRQLAALEREIAKQEAELEQLDRELEDAACDYIRLGELFPRKEALQGELEELYGQWEMLAEEEVP
jgi:hypothetical protein